MRFITMPLTACFMTVLCVCGACAQSKSTGASPLIPFETILKLNNSGITESRDIVIGTEDEWCRFWQEAHGNLVPAPPCDTTPDFTREAVVVSALGEKPNQCYDVTITSITEEFDMPYPPYSPGVHPGGQQWIVQVSDTQPDFSAVCLQAIATPVHAVKVGRQAPAEVEFMHAPVTLSDTPEPER